MDSRYWLVIFHFFVTDSRVSSSLHLHQSLRFLNVIVTRCVYSQIVVKVNYSVIPFSLRLVAATQMCIQLLRLGLPSPHREARLRRRELRQRQQTEEDDLAEKMKQLQAANENKQRQLEDMRMVLLRTQHEKTNLQKEAITPCWVQ